MNKLTLLSLVAASVLFTGCGEDAKKAVSDAATSATEAVKETTANAVDATKEAAASAAEAAKEKAAEVADAAAQKAADAAEALKERASAATEAAKETASSAVDTVKDAAAATTAAAGEAVASAKEAVTPDNAAGKAAFAKCAGCHGADGKTQALGKSVIIAGQSAAELEEALKGYKAGTRNVAGMGMLMKGQVASMSDEDIKAVSEYISGL